MLKELKERDSVFSEMNERMGNYFDYLGKIKKDLNKYVHKEGFDTFYSIRNHPFHHDSFNKDLFIQEFEKYLKASIGAVAVLRLTIDPFPILLGQEEIFCRTGNFITEPYTEEFISEYIGKENINAYKETNFYKGYYDELISYEPQTPEVSNVVKDQFIEKEKIDEILKQKHLLSFYDYIAVLLANISYKTAIIYCIGGLHIFITSTRSKNNGFFYDGIYFDKLSAESPKFNVEFNQAYISCICVEDEYFLIEHNELFSDDEIAHLNGISHLKLLE